MLNVAKDPAGGADVFARCAKNLLRSKEFGVCGEPLELGLRAEVVRMNYPSTQILSVAPLCEITCAVNCLCNTPQVLDDCCLALEVGARATLVMARYAKKVHCIEPCLKFLATGGDWPAA